jgi:hypothetical protein
MCAWLHGSRAGTETPIWSVVFGYGKASRCSDKSVPEGEKSVKNHDKTVIKRYETLESGREEHPARADKSAVGAINRPLQLVHTYPDVYWVVTCGVIVGAGILTLWLWLVAHCFSLYVMV